MGHAHHLAALDALHPHLDCNAHGGAANLEQRGVAADDVADVDRVEEGHAVDRGGRDAAVGDIAREDRTAEVHLRYEPAAKDVTVRIRMHRHRDRADHEFARRLAGRQGGLTHDPTLRARRLLARAALHFWRT